MQEQEVSIFEERVVYAGFWQRLGAYLIDALVLLVPDMLIARFIGGDLFSDLFHQRSVSSSSIYGELTSVTLYWLYTALMQSGRSQGTVGMMALGLKTTGMNGESISFAKATGRYFASYISGSMFWDDKNQTLHDKIAGTLIVRKQTEMNGYTV